MGVCAPFSGFILLFVVASSDWDMTGYDEHLGVRVIYIYIFSFCQRCVVLCFVCFVYSFNVLSCLVLPFFLCSPVLTFFVVSCSALFCFDVCWVFFCLGSFRFLFFFRVVSFSLWSTHSLFLSARSGVRELQHGLSCCIFFIILSARSPLLEIGQGFRFVCIFVFLLVFSQFMFVL